MAIRWTGKQLEKEDSAGVTDDSGSDLSNGLQQGYELGSLTDGLVAYFPFDGSVDDKALSSNVTDNTSADFVNGKVGTEAKDFDGSDDFIEISKSPKITGDITLSCWIRPDSLQSYSASFRTLIAKGGYSSADYALYIDSTDSNLIFTADGNYFRHESFTWQTSDWQHVVAVVNDNGGKLYLNGSPLSIDTSSGTARATDNGGTFRLGYDKDKDRYFPGAIDDVRIYDRALSQPEIEALYQRTSTQEITDRDRITSGLAAHYTLNEDSPGKAYDLSGNGLDSTSVTGTEVVPGLGGAKARRFDGNGDNIGIDSFTGDISSNVYAISFWVKTTAPGSDYNHCFFSVNSGDGQTNKIRILLKSNGYVNLNDGGPTGTIVVNDGKWHHITVVSRGNSFDTFIDGKKDIEDQGAPATLNSSDISTIAAEYDSSSLSDFIDADFCDFRIYNRELSKSEIESLARMGGL